MMETRMSFRVSNVAGFSPLLMNNTRSSSTLSFAISRALPGKFAGLAASLALAIVPLHLAAQQPYPSGPYGSYGSPYPQPAPQYGYGQPQYPQPQYQQPQNLQPQYGYAQPQYSAPQQPYAQPSPYPQQPYTQQQPYADQQQDLAPPPAAPAQALSAGQLDQMLAPIALYPDTLLAQILAASTYPAQVAVADQWLHQMQSQGAGSADQIAGGANAQTSWDPSVKALTAFPDVLDMLNQNLNWTTALGNAYFNQPQDVMQTVQVLRQRAEQAGNLESTAQEDVTSDQGYIQVAPPDPQQVYVPTYNPWSVYGQQISPYPGFSLLGALGSFFGSTPVQYALNYALGAFGRFPFGWVSWALNWLGQGIFFNHSAYYTHSYSVADWGLPHGGPRAYAGWRGSEGWHGGSDRAYGAQRGFDQHGLEQRGFDQRGPAQHGLDQRGYDQRGGAWANNRGTEQPYVHQAIGDAYNRGNSYSNRDPRELNRGSEAYGNGYTHAEVPARQAYDRAATQPGYSYRPQTYPNHGQIYASRPQSYTNPGFAYGNSYGYANRSTQSYASRPTYAYNNPYGSSRAPQAYSQPSLRSFSNRSYQSYGNSFAGNQHSGGFHLFGNSGGERAPKFSAPKYKAPKNFGGFGGSHSSHSFGGGGHSSHSFGGGHSSGHSGGGHHH
jgi:hypothetical protein